MPPHKKDTSIDQEKTALRTKLDDLSVFLKKLASAFLNFESDNAVVLLESQLANKLVTLGLGLQTLESLEGKEGEVFSSFLKDLSDTFEEIGSMSDWKEKKLIIDDFSKVLTMLKKIEDQTNDLLPIVVSIDEKRKEKNYETFGGMLQKFVDLIGEKRHLILRSLED